MTNSTKALPLGSIVYLKEGTVKMLIIGRSNLISKQENETPILFDYSAVMYPLGFIGVEKLFFFNNEDIDKVEFEGFSDSENEQFVKNMITYQESKETSCTRGNVDEFLEEVKKEERRIEK